MAFWGISRLTRRPAFAVVARYGLAVASVATALGTTLILRHYNFPAHFISHFTLIAIAITFWQAGTGPGLLAYLLSSLGVSILARNHFLLPTFNLEPFLIFYAIFSLLMGWFSASRRRAERSLMEARSNLELRVAERTGELTRANEDLQNTQAELRRSEADLLEAQRLSHTGSWKHDIASGKVTVSPEVYRIFGVGPDEVKSTTEFWLNRNHPEDAKRIQELFEESEIQKTDYEADYRIVLPDGTIRHLHAVGHPVVNESGDLVEFVGTAIDVTEQARARIELEKAFEEIKRLKDRLHDEKLALREQIDQAFMFEEIVGSSPALQTVLSSIVKVAPTDSTVLITGETGTGKELIARAIHKRSQRSCNAFISVNCASIPSSLVASELFGHEKGAFTGAAHRREGRFELAHSGTIFLDEVGELPAETQIGLLRVL